MAVGVQQIRTDSITFRFNDEVFDFPTYDVLGYKGIAHYNGSYYEAPIKALRKLKAKRG